VELGDIGVVIPAYNAEKTISPLVQQIEDFGFKKENIIVIDDGSTDGTAARVQQLGATIVQHDRNRGKGAALKTGFSIARARKLQGVVTLDADGQHRVSEIVHFLEKRADYDMIIGYRRAIGHMPMIRKLTNKTTSLVVSLFSRQYVPDAQCGFRFVNLRIFDTVVLRTDNYETESEMVVKSVRHKFRIGSVPISTVYEDEQSHIRPFIDTVRFMGMAARFFWH
jgi:glycosyltransferase involved in cell wall biosynthesis